jgi:hypothetical protein
MGDHGDRDPESTGRSSEPPTDPAEAPDAIVLTGYSRSDARAGYVRLYLDTGRLSYIDVCEADIRHREHAAGEESPVGPKTTLWIRRGAPLEYTTENP